MSPGEEPTVVLGPEAIGAVSQALDELTPTLAQSRYRVLPNGNLEFFDVEPAEAVKALRVTVGDALPEAVRDHIGRASGLGWNVFFGHVVGWWLPQRGRVGFLRALTDRAALHRIRLRLHWNQGRHLPPLQRPVGNGALVAGGVLGVVGGVVLRYFFPYDAVMPLLAVGAGVAAGRLYQRLGHRRVCADGLCRRPLGARATTCPECGASLR